MTSTINLLTPLSGARNVSTSSNIELEILKPLESNYTLNLQTLRVQINGIAAIEKGEFQAPSANIALDVGILARETDQLLQQIEPSLPKSTLPVKDTSRYRVGTTIQLGSEQLLISSIKDGYLIAKGLDGYGVDGYYPANFPIVFHSNTVPTRFITTTTTPPFVIGEYVQLQEQDILLNTLTQAANYIQVADAAQYRTGTILQIADEKMRVVNVNVYDGYDGYDGYIQVNRGYSDTNATNHSANTTINFYSTTVATQILNISGNIIELKDPVQGFTGSYPIGHLNEKQYLRAGPKYSSIYSINRGYSGSILENTSSYKITITPNGGLPSNSAIIVATDIASSYFSDTSAEPTNLVANPIYKSYAFRTKDTLPPQLVNFPGSIQFSNIKFSIVDPLSNGIDLSSLQLTLDEGYAIQSGVITNGFTGIVETRQASDGYIASLDITLRPKVSYIDNQKINSHLRVSDIYGNNAQYTRQMTNHAPRPRIEFIEAHPSVDTVLNPQNAQFQAKFINTDFIPSFFINLELRVGNTSYPIIKAGEFQSPFNGLYTVGHELTIKVEDLPVLSQLKLYGENIELHFLIIEANNLGDVPLDAKPIYTRVFSYSTVSSIVEPIIDSFTPAGTSVSATTSISFRTLSRAPSVALDPNSVTVTINSILALDNGQFKNSYTGSIAVVQGSDGNSLITTIQPSNPFNVNELVSLTISAADMSGNSAARDFNFTVANTNTPVISITPSSGSYSSLTRVSIAASIPSLIYYTIDGTMPVIGQINTLYGTSPIENIPIYREGITLVRAFAVSAANIKGPLNSETYDLNPFKPEVSITSPANNTTSTENKIIVEYAISIAKGFLSKVETILNNGIPVNTQNNLANSKALVVGLRAGPNIISIRATDNFGNQTTSSVNIVVQPSQIQRFDITYAPLQCPSFTKRPTIPPEAPTIDNLDTATVAIIGLGQRAEVVVAHALGGGLDGKPVNFVTNTSTAISPDGRHFELTNYPIRSDSLEVWLYRKNRNLQLSSSEFAINYDSGQIVLDHPLEFGESLTVKYIADIDINTPRIYTTNQQSLLFKRHGDPNPSNTLSLGAQIAFENGAQRVLAIQALPLNTDPHWSNTFKVLEQQEAYWIIPVVNNQQLSYYSGLRASSLQHAIKMSNIKYRKERIVVGYRQVNETHNNLPLNEAKSNRMILLEIDLSSSITRMSMGSTIQINGSFVACALAGLASNLPVSTPLSLKSITGFNLNTQQKSPRIYLDQLITQGFTPIQALSSGGQIYRGRTSYIGFAEPVKEEISTQRSIDYISKNLRNKLENQFVGKLISSSLLALIQSAANEFLATKADIISSGIVGNIEIDSKEPRQINLAIRIIPLYPLNNLEITMNLSMTL